MKNISPAMLNLSLLALLLVLSVASLYAGAAPLDMAAVWKGLTNSEPTVEQLILQEIRLPRLLLAILIGAALGLTGAVMQGWLRNPLADAGLLGTSACAALGSVLTLYFGVATANTYVLPLAGITGAFASIALIYLLAGKQRDVLTLILIGVALQYAASAGISLALNYAPNPHAALEITFWLMGSLKDRAMQHVYICIPLIILGLCLLLSLGRGLDALSLGETTAKSLGVDMRKLQLLIVLGTALCVGSSTAIAGSISFVGLVVPHLLRPLVGHLPSRLLLPSLLAGACLLLSADITVRLISALQELKLGVLTSVIGAPFFIYLLLSSRKHKGGI